MAGAELTFQNVAQAALHANKQDKTEVLRGGIRAGLGRTDPPTEMKGVFCKSKITQGEIICAWNGVAVEFMPDKDESVIDNLDNFYDTGHYAVAIRINSTKSLYICPKLDANGQPVLYAPGEMAFLINEPGVHHSGKKNKATGELEIRPVQNNHINVCLRVYNHNGVVCPLLCATRDIRPGEELLWHYGRDYRRDVFEIDRDRRTFTHVGKYKVPGIQERSRGCDTCTPVLIKGRYETYYSIEDQQKMDPETLKGIFFHGNESDKDFVKWKTRQFKAWLSKPSIRAVVTLKESKPTEAVTEAAHEAESSSQVHSKEEHAQTSHEEMNYMDKIRKKENLQKRIREHRRICGDIATRLLAKENEAIRSTIKTNIDIAKWKGIFSYIMKRIFGPVGRLNRMNPRMDYMFQALIDQEFPPEHDDQLEDLFNMQKNFFQCLDSIADHIIRRTNKAAKKLFDDYFISLEFNMDDTDMITKWIDMDENVPGRRATLHFMTAVVSIGYHVLRGYEGVEYPFESEQQMTGMRSNQAQVYQRLVDTLKSFYNTGSRLESYLEKAKVELEKTLQPMPTDSPISLNQIAKQGVETHDDDMEDDVEDEQDDLPTVEETRRMSVETANPSSSTDTPPVRQDLPPMVIPTDLQVLNEEGSLPRFKAYEAQRDEAASVAARAAAADATRTEAANRAYQLGRAAFEAGDFAAAEPHFLQAVEVAPEFPEAFFALSIMLTRMGRHEEAQARMATANLKMKEAQRVAASTAPPSARAAAEVAAFAEGKRAARPRTESTSGQPSTSTSSEKDRQKRQRDLPTTEESSRHVGFFDKSEGRAAQLDELKD